MDDTTSNVVAGIHLLNCPYDATFGERQISEITDRYAIISRADVSQYREVDVVTYEADGAITKQRMNATDVERVDNGIGVIRIVRTSCRCRGIEFVLNTRQSATPRISTCGIGSRHRTDERCSRVSAVIPAADVARTDAARLLCNHNDVSCPVNSVANARRLVVQQHAVIRVKPTVIA